MDYDMESKAENALKIETSFCLPSMEQGYLRQSIVVAGETHDAILRVILFPTYEVKLKDFVEDFFDLNAYDDSVNFIPALCTYRGKHIISPSYNGEMNHIDAWMAWGSPYTADSYNLPYAWSGPNLGHLYPDKIALSLAGDNGIYEKFWKFNANIFITSAKPITVTKGLQYFKNPRFDRLYRIGDTNFLLDIVKQTHTSTGIRVDEVTGRTVKYYE